MKTTYKTSQWVTTGVLSYLLLLTSYLFVSCTDDFLEVKNPTGEPLEEYYTTEGRYGIQRPDGRRRDYG